MRYVVRAFLATVVCMLVASSPARAAFHTYRVVEMFTSADGCVQFVRLHESAGGTFQNAWAGRTLTCSDGVTTHTITFPSNLPSSATANTDVLVATANLAALPGGVIPDFIIPAGFLFTNNATVSFAGGVSNVMYTALPTNGQQSLSSSGVTGTNTPRNFSAAAGSVNVPPGVCCVGAACSITVQVCCTGSWTSGGTCTSNPCAPPAGVCCAGVTCRVSTSAACTGANTLFVSSPACNGTGNNATPCCRADFNHNGSTNIQDIFDYIAAWFTGSILADFDGNGSGTPTIQSIFDFLAAWFAAC